VPIVRRRKDDKMKHESNGIDAHSNDQWTCKCGFKTWNWFLFQNHLKMGDFLETDEGKRQYTEFRKWFDPNNDLASDLK
jgi:hypothetical protein